MASPKTSLFPDNTVRLAQWAKALGHPARVAILKILLEKKACVCGALVSELPLSQATVSQHLKALKEAGIVKGNIEGPAICYCIDSDTWNEMRGAFGALIVEDPFGPNCC